jgi:hypothetical protein
MSEKSFIALGQALLQEYFLSLPGLSMFVTVEKDAINDYWKQIKKKFAEAGIEPGIFWFLLLTYIGSLKLQLSIKL